MKRPHDTGHIGNPLDFGPLTPITSGDFFQSVLDGIQDSIKIVDDHYRIVYANRASELRSGKQVPQLLGKACHSEFYGFDKPCAFCHTARTFRDGKTEVSAYEAKGSDGQMQYYELTSYPVKDSGGRVRYVIEITKDITERKRLEQQLLHSERLASMGTLASSIAHEINNPLSAILGFAQDLLTETDESDERSRSLRIIEQEAIRCANVLQRLLHFTRPHAPMMSQTNLHDVIDTSLALIRPQARKQNVEIRRRFDKRTPIIEGDSNLLEQLFLNLILNSLQAMPSGGRLNIATKTTDNAIDITVTDNGEGIAPQALSRVFEPFYSSKGIGGTGLGLAICKRTVEQHNGTIEIQSRPGKGTTVHIKLAPKS